MRKSLTIVCIDSIDYDRAFYAVKRSVEKLPFAKGKILTHLKSNLTHYQIEKEIIRPVLSKEDYSYFVLKELTDYIDTDYALIVQWDGFVVNGNAWSDVFFEYDYIGAPWHWDKIVGNGGFSLRSKKLLDYTKIINWDYGFHPEDAMLCRTYRDFFENAVKIKFAPLDIAYKFSVENEPYSGQLGWHGGCCPIGFPKNLL